MKHLALFNGIGGFQLAANWIGWDNVAHVEINEWCNKVVNQHFPNSKCYTDIKKFNGKEYANTIDIISGGFPCQPFSVAGERKGKEDDRYLWPEMLRTIREIQPSYIVGENVNGLVNWNGGLVFNEVQTDLENEGYEVQPVILPACAVNTPHYRQRIWFIANSYKSGLQKTIKGYGQTIPIFTTPPNEFSRFNANKWGICKRNIGELRTDNGVPNWLDRIASLGNAIVPQVAYEIFKVIDTINKMQ